MNRFLLSLLFCIQVLGAASSWYVSPHGTNTNLGNGPAPNQAWRTITCAINTSNTFLSAGDTVYIAPGTYREYLTLNKGYATTPLYVQGDPRNEKGFTDLSGNPVEPNYVRWTSHTTDDRTASAGNLITFASGTTNYHISDMWLDAGRNTSPRYIVTSSYQMGLHLVRCVLTAENAMYITPGADVPIDAHLTNCIVKTDGTALYYNASAAHTSNLNALWDVVQCVIHSWMSGINLVAENTAQPSYAVGGVNVLDSLLQGYYAFRYEETTPTNLTATKIQIKGCILIGYYGISGGTNNTLWDNSYNVFSASTERSGAGIPTGTGESINYMPLMEFGQSDLWFRSSKPFGMPTRNSPLLSFRDDLAAGTGGTDILGRMRPSGSGYWGAAFVTNACGPMEFHDIGTRTSVSTNVDDGTYSIKMTGPGDHQIALPVPASATTVTVRVKWDSTYAGTKPQVVRVAQPELISADAGETKTATGAANAWETLTFTAFTPTRKGVVYLRLVSNDTAGNGNVWFDRLSY